MLVFGGTQLRADFQGSTHLMPFDEDTIAYSKTADSNVITRLQKQLGEGKAGLKFDAKYGYLPAVLDLLKIDPASQLLVFSKTSFQRERISPATPRSLFFNDEVYIGYIPGSPLLEVSLADPKLGGVFYTLAQTESAQPKFVRNDQCLECHVSAKSLGVPGHLLRSFDVDEQGVVDLNTGTSLVNHRTPFAERWGGWYVTGDSGNQTHRGNLFGKAAQEKKAKDPAYRRNLENLGEFFDTKLYYRGTSDLVALMVLEHQVHMHNFITRINYEATIALQQYGHLNYLKNPVDAFLRYALFTEEVLLTDPLKPSSEFARSFGAIGLRDRKGRSLRDLDLHTRLFKYPLSFLIYSESFRAIQPKMKERLFERLHAILTGEDKSPDWAGLSPETRQALLEIVTETIPDLPAVWKAKSK